MRANGSSKSSSAADSWTWITFPVTHIPGFKSLRSVYMVFSTLKSFGSDRLRAAGMPDMADLAELACDIEMVKRATGLRGKYQKPTLLPETA